jgi:hypothetical protein
MVEMLQPYYIINISQRLKYLLGVDKNNVINFKPNHWSPYIIVRYRQNTNIYNKIFDNPVVDNQYQSIIVNMFFLGWLFMLKPFKISSSNSSDLHNIYFWNLRFRWRLY